MRSYVVACLLLLTSPAVLARAAASKHDVCGDRTHYDGTVFTLDIERSFHPRVTFKLCQRTDPKENFLLITTESRNRPRHSTDRRISLDERAFARVVALYEAALSYNVKDDDSGTDGSMWCLETQRGFTYSKACFYMPSENSKARGLSGLSELGKELWHFAAMEPIVGELY